MKIKDGRITILVSEEKTRIEIRDNDASVTFVRIELTPVQLSQALSRLAMTECDIDVHNLNAVGKKLEHKPFEFKVGKHRYNKLIVHGIAMEECPAGWEPDSGYSSKGSFFEKDGEQWARTTIRRWV
jgi:hypothetical protein